MHVTLYEATHEYYFFAVIDEKLKDSLPEHDTQLSSIRWHLSEGRLTLLSMLPILSLCIVLKYMKQYIDPTRICRSEQICRPQECVFDFLLPVS